MTKQEFLEALDVLDDGYTFYIQTEEEVDGEHIIEVAIRAKWNGSWLDGTDGEL